MSNIATLKQRGFTVLIATLVATVVLAIGLSIMGITMKQLKLSGISRESEIAFQSANAAMECVRYHDLQNDAFDVPGDGSDQPGATTVSCFGVNATNANGTASSTSEQEYVWTWDSNEVCSVVILYKFYEEGSTDGNTTGPSRASAGLTGTCPEDVECTVIKARGYNKPCSLFSSDKTVERELTVVY